MIVLYWVATEWEEIMDRLFELQLILIQQVEKIPFFWRDLFEEIVDAGPVFGILGARGVGKTTFLLHLAMRAGAKEQKALYFSADNAFFINHTLSEVVEHLYKHTDVRKLYIDEIHKYSTWKMELKNIIDTYPSMQIVFSGSSMIDLAEGKYDLSRRVVLYQLHGFSFREYMSFYHGVKMPKLTLDELVKEHLTIASELKLEGVLKLFNDYLRIGYYPFLKSYLHDRDKFQLLDNAVQMAIYEDVAVLHALKTPSLLTIEQLYKYILNSSPGEFNASKLARVLNKDFDSIVHFLNLLQRAGLIRFLYSGQGEKAHIRNPVKLYPENTNLIYAAHIPLAPDQMKGKIRETFFLNQLQNSGADVFHDSIGDFKVSDFTFEVGGKGKTKRKETDNGYLLSDDIFVGTKSTIPLYLMGCLY